MPAKGSGVFTGESKEEHRCGSALGNRRRSRTDEEAAASLSLQYTVWKTRSLSCENVASLIKDKGRQEP